MAQVDVRSVLQAGSSQMIMVVQPPRAIHHHCAIRVPLVVPYLLLDLSNRGQEQLVANSGRIESYNLLDGLHVFIDALWLGMSSLEKRTK